MHACRRQRPARSRRSRSRSPGRGLTGQIGHFARLAADLTPAEEEAVLAEVERRLGDGDSLRLGRSLVVVTARQ